MLGVIGIGPEAERVYGALLSEMPATVEELAVATGLSGPEVGAAISQLESSRLAEPGPGAAYMAADPAVALDVLLVAHEHELKRARVAAQEYAERYRLAVGRRDPAELVEIVTGRQAIVDRLQQAQRAARRELRGFDKPPYAAAPSTFVELEGDLLRRGGTARVIYDRAAVQMPGRMADLEACAVLGEQARVLPELPAKLFLIDDALAILPLQAEPEAIESAVVLHKSGLLGAIDALFETLWSLAMPLRFPGAGGAIRDEGMPSAEERRILALMTAGIPDEVIARELGVSERTHQRRVHGMMERLHVQTRFQLARQAGLRGWFDDGTSTTP